MWPWRGSVRLVEVTAEPGRGRCASRLPPTWRAGRQASIPTARSGRQGSEGEGAHAPVRRLSSRRCGRSWPEQRALDLAPPSRWTASIGRSRLSLAGRDQHPGQPRSHHRADLAARLEPCSTTCTRPSSRASQALGSAHRPRPHAHRRGRHRPAATFGAVDTVLVDIGTVVPGAVDEATGAVTFAPDTAASYGVVTR